MKPKAQLRSFLLLAASNSLLAIFSASAADGTYTSQTGAWNVEGSWQGNVIADGADSTAFFTNDVTANATTSLGANRTIGNIVFTDGDILTPFNRTIGNTSILTFDVTTGAPTIDVTQTLRLLTISSQISGSDGLTKKGVGLLLLSSASNNFTGTLKVEAGRLQVDANNRLGNAANPIVVDSGSTFYASGSGQTYTRTGNTSISGLGWVEQDLQSTPFGALRVGHSNSSTLTNTYTGTITLTGDARIGAAAYGTSTSTNTFSGKITGGFGVDFFGATTFNATSTNGHVIHRIDNPANDYTGNTTITNGGYGNTGYVGSTVSKTTLRLGASDVIPNGASAGNVVFALHGTNTTSTVVLDLRGRNETINGLTVNPGSFTARITNDATTGTSASVLTIGDNNTTSSFSGIIEDNAATRTLGITKIGSGTLSLSGANTYRGATTVSGGTLKLATAGSLANETNLSIAAGATFDLAEKTAGPATYTWNMASLGASGAATAATLAGTAGGTIDLGATPISLTTDATNPSLTVTGADLNLGGNAFTVNVPGPALTAGVYTLVSAPTITGTVNPTPTFGNVDDLVVGGSGVVSISGNTVILTVTVTSSPYDLWAISKGLTGAPGSPTDPAKDADPDKDGRDNLAEFAFNGDPLSGADNGKVFVLIEDSDSDGDADKELILTVAVRTGMLAFSGSPSPSANQAADNITYTIEGSTDLSGFSTTVNVVPTPVATGLPAAGAGYEYRSFSLNGSNGLPGKGFLRAKVTSP